MDVEDFQSRKGKFILTDALVDEHPESVLEVMRYMVIVRAEHRPWDQAYHYHAYSELFDRVEPGTEVPKYQIEVHASQDGPSSIRAVKVGH